MAIIEWWNSLTLAAQVFCCMAIPSTLILLIQTLLMFVGLGDDADGATEAVPDELADGAPDTETGDGVFGEDSVTEPHDGAGLNGLRIFTVRGIVAFFVVFGWVGLLLQNAGVRLLITVPVATVCGVVMMVLMALILKAIMRLRSDGNIDNRNAIGTAGKVYLTVPPSRSGSGKVQIVLQGSYVERNAVTDDKESIPTGCEIVVVGISGVTDLVVRKK